VTLAATVFGAVATALLASIGWLLRLWMRGLADKVDSRADDLKAQINGTASTVAVLDVKLDDTREGLAEVRGALGLHKRPGTLLLEHRASRAAEAPRRETGRDLSTEPKNP
jgi:hypothetical protein